MHSLKDGYINPLGQKVMGLKSTLKQVSNSLKVGIKNNTLKINRLGTLMGLHTRGNAPSTPFSEIERLEAKIEKNSLEVVQLKNSHKEKKSFHGLGFRSFDEARAWLQIKVPTEQFGFIVDFQTIIEHIFTQITGMDSLKQLEKIIS